MAAHTERACATLGEQVQFICWANTIWESKPTKEGYKEFAVSPVLGGLKWMEGTVPTPNGDIHVYMDNKTIKVKATEGKGYLTIQSRRQPKANMGTVEKVSEGVWRLWIDSPEERIVTYRL